MHNVFGCPRSLSIRVDSELTLTPVSERPWLKLKPGFELKIETANPGFWKKWTLKVVSDLRTDFSAIWSNPNSEEPLSIFCPRE